MKRLKNRGLDVIFMMKQVDKYVVQWLVSSTGKLEHLDLQWGLREEEKKKMEGSYGQILRVVQRDEGYFEQKT